MKKHGLLTRAAAVAALSAAIAGPTVAGLTAGTASAKPMCDILSEHASFAWDQHGTAVSNYDHAGAAFWLKEFRASRAASKKAQCGQ